MTPSALDTRGFWVARPAPHRAGGSSQTDIMQSWMLAAAIAGLAGTVIFGASAARVLIISMLAATVTDFAVGYLRGRAVVGGLSHASLTGLVLGLTLPATVGWQVPAVGAIVAVVFGKVVFGGLGHFLWQPALVGRVVVQLVFLQSLTLTPASSWPVLAPGHLLLGRLNPATHVEMPGYSGWKGATPSAAHDAVNMSRPIQSLRAFAEGHVKPDDGDLAFTPLLRDLLPPWQDTLFGTVPGGIGETCCLALIVGGLYLIHRGFLRWQMPAAMLGAAAAAAAILPVESGAGDGSYSWFPIFAVEEGRAVGVAYVAYHLTAGELMLGAMLLAGDMTTTPLRARGQALFAAGAGALTIFMRLYGVIECECYWSILAMNTLVGVIDRRIKRPVLGMEPA